MHLKFMVVNLIKRLDKDKTEMQFINLMLSSAILSVRYDMVENN